MVVSFAQISQDKDIQHQANILEQQTKLLHDKMELKRQFEAEKQANRLLIEKKIIE
jgi:hypothetical protein